MKNLIFFLAFFTFTISFAQDDLEQRDDSFIIENNKNLLKIDIQEPFLQVAVKDCTDFKASSFEGGIASYKELLRKYMFTYLNSDYYTLAGEFIFTLTIDAAGKVTDVEGSPKVLNSEVFFDDMQYVVRRIKKNWSPATCNGKAIKSEIKIKMNFSSVSADL